MSARRKAIEMTTLQQKNSLNLRLRTNEELNGRLAVVATGYFQVIVFGWVAGSFRETLVLLFYYSTTCYYIRMLYETAFHCIL